MDFCEQKAVNIHGLSDTGLLCIMFFLVPMGINAEAEDVFSLAEKRIVLLISEVKDCTCLCSVS